jgi:hypothetical protein
LSAHLKSPRIGNLLRQQPLKKVEPIETNIVIFEVHDEQAAMLPFESEK